MSLSHAKPCSGGVGGVVVGGGNSSPGRDSVLSVVLLPQSIPHYTERHNIVSSSTGRSEETLIFK